MMRFLSIKLVYKLALLSFIIVFLHSCSRVIEEVADQVTPEPKELSVAIKNKTGLPILRAEIRTGNFIQVYGDIKPNQFSEFKPFNTLYSEAYILINTPEESFKFTPESIVQSTKVDDGSYYFEVSLTSSKTLKIIRKSF